MKMKIWFHHMGCFQVKNVFKTIYAIANFSLQKCENLVLLFFLGKSHDNDIVHYLEIIFNQHSKSSLRGVHFLSYQKLPLD
jgi:hypothetical protein